MKLTVVSDPPIQTGTGLNNDFVPTLISNMSLTCSDLCNALQDSCGYDTLHGTQSGTGMLRYWTELPDAGMSMPGASVSMPMPSYV
jgi:hypothetical protein